MNPKSSITQKLPGARSWRSCLQLLVALAILCWGSLAKAQTSETWMGTNSTGTTPYGWTNQLNWVDNTSGVNERPTFLGDNLTFGGSATVLMLAAGKAPVNDFPYQAATAITTNLGLSFFNYTNTFATNAYVYTSSGVTGPVFSYATNVVNTNAPLSFITTNILFLTNGFGSSTTNVFFVTNTIDTFTNVYTYLPFANTNNLNIGSITFTTNGITLSGTALTISNGISDNSGWNTNSIPMTLGKAQTFANSSAAGYTNFENGTLQLVTNKLTVGGSQPLFLNGVISSTNGGNLVINNGGLTRLSAANLFGTNTVAITNNYTAATIATNYLYYTNYTGTVGGSTNISTIITNTFYVTNGITMNTNILGPQNPNVVWVEQGVLQLNNAAAIPNGANVGDLSVDATLDLNGQNQTINGLTDSGGGSGLIDNISTVNTGVYTLTLGNGNSNAVYTGVIGSGTTAGSIGVTKIGTGTQTFTAANQYVGPTIINQGKIVVASGASIGAGPVLTIASGAQLDVSANNPGGYIPAASLTVSAGTPYKPYTNFLGSYDPNQGTNFVVSTTATNTLLTYLTNIVTGVSTNIYPTTNITSYTYSTNTILSIVTNDVIGNFVVNGGGAIYPNNSVAAAFSTWSIKGNLTIDNSLGLGSPNNNNRANFVLNNVTTPGGGTNDLIAVNGTLSIGDQLNVVVTPFTGTLAGGASKYTLFTSTGGFTPSSTIDTDPVVFNLIAERGITGTFSHDANNVYLTASGTGNPGSVIWAGTPTKENWDIDLTQNWITNGPTYPNPDYFFPQDNVTFNDNGVGVVTIPNPVSPGSVTFNNTKTNYTFTQNSGTYMLGAAGGFVKNGGGTVTLQNPNELGGPVTVNQGILALGYWGLGNQNALFNGVPAQDLILGGGEILENSAVNVDPLVYFQDIVINAGASLINQATRGSGELPIYGVSNNVTRAEGGVLDVNLSGKAGSFAGLYFVSTNSPDGTNDFGTNGIVGGWATYALNDWLYANTAVTTANGGTMQYPYYTVDNNYLDWGIASNILIGQSSGTAVINVSGNAKVNTIKFTNAVPVQLDIAAGDELAVNSGGILIPSGGVFRNQINGGGAGAFLTASGSPDLIILNQNSSLGSSLTISCIITNDGPIGLTTGGAGTTILTGNNTYTGETIINGAYGGFVGAALGTVQVGANGTSGSISSSSDIIDNGNLAFNRSDSVTAPPVSGTGNLVKLSAGVLSATANNSLSGLVTISGGTLQLGNGGSAGSFSNVVGIIDNANLVFDNNNTVSYSNSISGYGSLVQFGTGTLIIPTNETYSGNTTVSNGTLKLLANGYLTNTTAIAVGAGAILDVSALSGGGLTLRSAAPAEVLDGYGTINGSIATASGTTLEVEPAAGSATGTLTITNALTLGGGNYNFNVGSGSNDKINVGGTLNENSGTVVVNVFGGNLNPGVYKLIQETGTPTLTVGLVPNLSLFGFHQAGSIAVLTNDTTSSLSLFVYPGSIPALAFVGSNPAFPGGLNNNWDLTSADWTNVVAGGPLTTYANPDYTLIDELYASTNPVVDIQTPVSSTTITVNSTNLNYTLGLTTGSGKTITGGASLVKNGPGQLTLLTTNNYLGTSAINQGTLVLGNNTAQAEDGLLGSGAITNGGTLIVNDFATETIPNTISGSGVIVQQGVGKLILAGNASGQTGGILITNGILQVGVGTGGSAALGTGNVTNNRSLLFDIGPTPVSSLTVSANISGIGGITNIGPGIVTLTGNNTYSNTTVIPVGTIQAGSVNAIPTATTVLLDTGTGPTGTLDLNGNNVTIAGLAGASTGIATASFTPSKIVNNGNGLATLTINGGFTNTIYAQILDNNNSGSGTLALALVGGGQETLDAGNNASGANSTFPNLFSGGIMVSNAVLVLGVDNSGNNTGNEGSAAAGLGTISLWGTNTVMQAHEAIGSVNDTGNTSIGIVNVPSGQTATICGPQRATFTSTLQGSGNLSYLVTYTRGRTAGDWSQFAGTLNLGTDGSGGNMVLDQLPGWPSATVNMQTNNNGQLQMSGSVSGHVFPIGALTGGDNSSDIGGGTVANGDGTAPTIWAIGSLNLSTTNGSQITDAGCGIRKVGTGTLVLTNNILSWNGQCVVSNGTLAFAPLALGVVGTLTNNYLVASNYTIVSPGVLDISAAGSGANSGTLYLGHSFNGQSLFGNGTLKGQLVTMAGTNTFISPGLRVNRGGTFPGQLTIASNVILNANSTLQMNVARTNAVTSGPTNDSLVVTGAGNTLTINATTLSVVNAGDSLWVPQTTNVFPFFAGSVNVNLGGNSGGITNVTAFTNLPAGVFWVTNLNGTLSGYPTVPAGAMALVDTNALVSTTPFTLTNSYDGVNLHLSWPVDHTGYRLEAQTNTLANGLSNNWVDVDAQFAPPANTVNAVTIPVVNTNGSVFYQLIYP
jgi:autotransporter-associated beta strand protein